MTGPYRLHDPMSDPGRFAGAPLGPSAAGPAEAMARVQGVLLHDHFGRRLYGEPPKDLDFSGRRTVPVAQRLAKLAKRAPDGDPLTARPPFERAVGTCRDFALLLTALLREAGLAARVRCGFAAYFEADRYEDHWLCEVRSAGGVGGWRRADAQLDPAHVEALDIRFDPADVPADAFLDAATAWRLTSRGVLPPARFGHGEDAVGDWFLLVNLMRDAGALCGAVTSSWDGWRACPAERRTVTDADRHAADRLAREILDDPDRPPRSTIPSPPWL